MTTLIEEDEIRFDARDGYSLSGRIIAPDNPRAAVLISSGTGFPKGFYRRIALAGAEHGFACLVYDYRGIAGSAPERLRGFRADILDWGRLDMPAALDRAEALAPGKPLYTLGHSVGGHLIGLADNAGKARAHAFVCCGSGHWGRHRAGYKPRVKFFWFLYGPACLALAGYIPAGGAWGGTALPREVFLQWRRWASLPGYLGDDLENIGEHCYDRIAAPIRSYQFSDDPIATEGAVQDILDIYTSAPSEMIRLAPADLGLDRVDHAGAFRRGAERFWPMPFDWFDTLAS
ncbi:alpha/beta hydrolase [Maricaulis sp.]|uniref:alpha/beta hydrolase family protein n=1 Tax=Maricaulis sp. TaxID=1486257 RepID=UPI002607AB79|nr:alpha/beta hydrolase [Maricaulis sp.]